MLKLTLEVKILSSSLCFGDRGSNSVVSALVSEEKVAESSFSGIDAFQLTYLEVRFCNSLILR